MRKIISVSFLALLLAACGGETTISEEEFNKLEKGMTYEEVKDIVGGNAESDNVVSDEMSVNEYRYNTDDGSNVSLIFINEKLDTKVGFEDDSIAETETTPEVAESLTWNESIERIIADGGSETEKADAVEMLARDYAPTEDDLATFSDDIINEFKTDQYIMNLKDEVYTLSNLFKSVVVERNTNEPMKSFAFDFYQNTKYNYRGAENKISESTVSNEEQMNKALTEMGK